jgi:replication factor C subunit 3/5
MQQVNKNQKQYDTNLPWVEKYRPKNIDDVLHPPITKFINDLMNNDFLPHMVFYGVAGTGKTSTIFAIANEYFQGEASKYVLELNASDDRGISVVRSQIKEFCQLQIIKKQGINIKYKLVILDEADALTDDAQGALRRIIETYTFNTRFCLICNYLSKLIDAILSRSLVIIFPKISNKVMKEAITKISKKENIKLSPEQIRNIIFTSNGDLRKGINLLQNMCLSDNYSAIELQLSSIIKIIDYIKENTLLDSYNEFIKIRNIENFSISDFLNKLLNYILENYIDNPNINKCIIQLAQIEKNALIGSIEKIHICAIISTLKEFFSN